jgi:hypothetical protein
LSLAKLIECGCTLDHPKFNFFNANNWGAYSYLQDT